MKANTRPGCAHCGHELKGRSDQKFCNDNCRNNHRFQSLRTDNEVIYPIMNILKKNRNILIDFMPKSKYHIAKKEDLLEAGYNFKYATEHKTMDGYDYYFCFDIGFVMEQQGQCKIMKRDYFDFISKPLPLWIGKLSATNSKDMTTKKLRRS